MRHFAFLSLASFTALAVAACGTVPDGTEKSASEGQALGVHKCPVGQRPDCSGDGPQGQEICTCVAACNVSYPAYGPSSYVQSWAVLSPDGTCPDVAGSGGTWKDLQSVQSVPGGFDGVPCEIRWASYPVRSCAFYFGSAQCCTYVWWPTGFVAPSTQVAQTSTPSVCPSEPQDELALCGFYGYEDRELYAMLAGSCPESNESRCDGGGGSSCNTCLRPAGP